MAFSREFPMFCTDERDDEATALEAALGIDMGVVQGLNGPVAIDDMDSVQGLICRSHLAVTAIHVADRKGIAVPFADAPSTCFGFTASAS